LGARHSAVDTFACCGIGARDQVQMATRFGGSGDFCSHIMRVCEFFIVEMAAFLWKQLVLNVDSSGTCVLECTHHMHDIERFTVASVSIDKQRQSTCPCDLADEEGNLIHCNHAEVRYSHGGGHGSSGEVKPAKARLFSLKGRHSVMRTR